MKKLFNYLATTFFFTYTRMKGYRFSLVTTPEENRDAELIFKNEGYKLPSDLEPEMEMYKKHTIKFIAYHNDVPVGTVGLADPKIANRPFDLHSIDEKGEHFEIQSLIVSKKHRECSQLVLLGLFKEMYTYSISHAIKSWISFGLRQLYITMRRYNKQICLLNVNSAGNKGPLAVYLYENNIFDSCSIMKVEDFQPAQICIKFVKKCLRKTSNKIRFLFL